MFEYTNLYYEVIIMGINKLEIGNNYVVFNVNDFNSFDFDDLNRDNRDRNLKIEIHLESLNMLDQFNNSDILDKNDLHVRLKFTKQNYLLLNTTEIMKKCIIKSVSVNDMIIVLEIFVTDNVKGFVLNNNIKVLERLNYISNDIHLLSKNHEILYQANLILKELHKSDNKVKNAKSRIDKLSEYLNS